VAKVLDQRDNSTAFHIAVLSKPQVDDVWILVMQIERTRVLSAEDRPSLEGIIHL
jgi:hypothetical protein